MTEEDKRAGIVAAALEAGFKPISCPLTAQDVLHTAEIIDGAPHMLAVTEADLHRFVRGVRRQTVETTVVEMSHMLLTMQGAAKSYMSRNNALLAKNIELEQRARKSDEKVAKLESRLAGSEGVTSDADGAKFLIVDTDNFGGDYPDEKVIARIYMGDEADAQELADAFYAEPLGSRYAKVVQPGYKLQPGFEP